MRSRTFLAFFFRQRDSTLVTCDRRGFLLAALLFAAPAAAESVELRCKIIGPAATFWGELQVMFDEADRHVHIKAEKQPGFAWDYKDGAVASIYAGTIPAGAGDDEPVAQFVKIADASVELGFRADDGAVLHLASFNRSALHGKPCVWRSHWDFGLS
jgi:hypothetical protein